MMFGKKQSQSQLGSGTAVQATGNVIVNVNNQGLSKDDARELFLDLFKANLIEFKGIAQQTAEDRAIEITEVFLAKLLDEHPCGLLQAQTPNFQNALFTVQKEHAMAGDTDLGALLVDLLVDRTKEQDRNLMQIVLNESLHTAPKLTAGQIATLSVLFFFKKARSTGITNLEELAKYFEKHLGTVIGHMDFGEATFTHLEFAGCGTTSLGEITLENIWLHVYPGLFRCGFEKSRLDAVPVGEENLNFLTMPCLNDPSKWQVAALNKEILAEKLAERRIEEPHAQQFRNMLDEGPMESAEVGEKILNLSPSMRILLPKWASSGMKNFNLTSVGMAIGHANIKRYAGEFAPLSIWIK